MVYEHIVDSLSEAETANTRKDRRKRRKSESVVETMEKMADILTGQSIWKVTKI